MRKMFLLTSILLLTGIRPGLAAPGADLLKVENSLAGVSIKAIDGPSPAPGAEAPLRVRFEIRNNSGRVLQHPEIELQVLGADGTFKGFYGTRLAGSLAAGETQRVLLRTDTITVRSDDTIILSPVSSTLKPVATPERTLLEKLTPEACDTLCAAKDLKCETRCPCGVKSFSCSCGEGGGFNYSCTCESPCPG